MNTDRAADAAGHALRASNWPSMNLAWPWSVAGNYLLAVLAMSVLAVALSLSSSPTFSATDEGPLVEGVGNTTVAVRGDRRSAHAASSGHRSNVGFASLQVT